MALTEYEKKILEQMEASLREEDPALASQMSAPVSEEPESILLGVVGFAVTVAGVLYAFSRPSAQGRGADESRSAKKNKGGGWDSFIQDQERRWDNRKDDD